MMECNDYPKLPKEKEKDYIIRICNLREPLGMTWSEITEILNNNLNLKKSCDAYRKIYTRSLDSNEDILLQIKKEKIKLADERSQNNAILRRITREETLREIAEVAVRSIKIKNLLIDTDPIERYDTDIHGILQLSDWHYGIDINSYFNIYNPDIARDRVSILYKKVIQYIDQNKISDLWIVNTGDMIAGNIHLPIRLNSRIDIITQTIEVSELLAQFISNLSSRVKIHYTDCLDNHSRIDPIKENSLDLESLQRIITWYLKSRLEDYHIDFIDNEIADDICTFYILGYSIAAVHGHNDKPEKLVDNLTTLTKQDYDLILTSHRHHFSADEKNETLVISNSSLMGTDQYAEKLRLSARPAQNLILVTEDSVAECIYRILVDN